MRKWLLLFILLAVPAYSQTVLPDKIMTGINTTEFVPRYATFLPNSLTVNGTYELQELESYEAIEILAGSTLSCPRDKYFTLYVTHIIPHPSSNFDCGKEGDPVSGLIIIRDRAIDVTKDPLQFGNGIINFGNQTRVGKTKTEVVYLNSNVTVGTTVLNLLVPSDWEVGDELVIPDMRQMEVGKTEPRKEPKLSILSKTANSVTLDKPLTFEHEAIGDEKVPVLNMTRSLNIVSENPNGVKGHTINLPGSTSVIEYNRLTNLGRTTIQPLSATNQVGRYASHDHHLRSSPGKFIGNVLVGGFGSKIGHAVHFTDDTLVSNNIISGFAGTDLFVEDGQERRNVFRDNFLLDSVGNRKDALTNVTQNCPACEGTNFWIRSGENTFERNRVYNGFNGISIVYQNQVLSPSYDPRRAVPVSFTDNVAISNISNGMDFWNMINPFWNEGSIAAHNGERQLFPKLIPGQFRNFKAIASNGKSVGVAIAGGYTPSLKLEDGEIVGCYTGLTTSAYYISLKNVKIQCVRGILPSLNPVTLMSDSVSFLPYGTNPKQYVVFSTSIWSPGQKLPYKYWYPSTGGNIFFKNWNNTGQDYYLYELQQHKNNPAWLSSAGPELGCPESNLTLGQCWDKYGIAPGGGVTGSFQTLEGVNGYVSQVKDAEQIPHAVLVYPVTPVTNFNGRPRFIITNYGVLAYQVDGGLVKRATANNDGVATISGSTLIGVHTIQTWIEMNGLKVQGSERVWSYTVN